MNRRPQQSDHKVTIVPVHSLRTALRIYARPELGFELVRLGRGQAEFRTRRSDQRVMVKEGPTRATLSLVVDDIDLAAGSIVTNGGVITTPLENLAFDRHAICEDGDGNRLDLRETKRHGGVS
jgi:hypothetical protein